MKLCDIIKVSTNSTYVRIKPDGIRCTVSEIPKELYDRKVRRIEPYSTWYEAILDGDEWVGLGIWLEPEKLT